MFLDFDVDVVAFAAQPFWLHWPGEDRGRRHAPDFFARRGDGTGVVIDVRPDGRIGEPNPREFRERRQPGEALDEMSGCGVSHGYPW